MILIRLNFIAYYLKTHDLKPIKNMISQHNKTVRTRILNVEAYINDYGTEEKIIIKLI